MGFFRMQKPWFRPVLNNLLFLPIRWQGWAFSLLLFIITINTFIRIDSITDSLIDTIIGFVPRLLMFIVIYYAFCFLTAEKKETHHS